MKKQHFLIFAVLFFLIFSSNAQQPAKPAPAKAPATKPAVTKAPAAKPAVAKAPAVPVAKIYKYIIKGGHVIDPKNNIDGIMDIAIDNGYRPSTEGHPFLPAREADATHPPRAAMPEVPYVPPVDGQIALVAKYINPALATQVIDATGLYVTPGLIDLHVHAFWGNDLTGRINYKNGLHGIAPDGFTFRSGVTTILDAGSPGWRDFEQYKLQTINPSRTRVLVLLNILGLGMDGMNESNTSEINADKAVEMWKKYPQYIKGIKNAHYGNGNNGTGNLPPIREGIKAAAAMGGIFMLDGSLTPAVMDLFRPGDIFTHMYGRPLVDSLGKIQPFVAAARARGVIFDVGFGGSSFRFNIANPAMKEHFWPNSISSDQHISSMNTAMKDMQNIMGLFMAMGIPLKEVVKMTTWNPAQEIHMPMLGNLSVGAPADVAIFEVRPGNYTYWGSGGTVKGTKRIYNEVTIRGGNVEWILNGRMTPMELASGRGGGGGGRGGAGGGRGGAAPAGGRAGGAAPANP